MAEADIRVLVGVKGSGDVDGASGKLIQKELTQIAKGIVGGKAPRIIVSINTEKTTDLFQTQLNKIIKSLKISPVKLTVDGSTTNSNVSSTSKKGILFENFSGATVSTKRMTQATAELTKAKIQNVQLTMAENQSHTKFINRSKERVQSMNEEVAAKKAKRQIDKVLDIEAKKRESVQKELTSLAAIQSKSSTNISSFDNYLHTIKPEALSQFANEIKQIQLQFSAAATAQDKFAANTSYTKATNNLRALKGTLKQVGAEGANVFTHLDAKIKSFATYLIGSGLTIGLVSQFTTAITTIKSMDEAMTELKKVTEEADYVYQNFFERSIENSKKLGASVADVVQATADYARLGYGLAEAESLAQSSIIYKNVGDGIENISSASESIISTMKAFNIEAKNSIDIVDKFNAVGNNYSISSKNIGDALQRSASALSVAGNDINESIALIVAGNEVVQDADVVGTALKTSALRLTSTKGELEALGEDAEGAAESITKLQTQLLNLTKGKVNIMLNEDTFKSTYQIMLEMSKVWDKMTQKDQLAALDLMFGKKTANVGASIIQNMSTAENVVGTSKNSNGSAISENEKYLDSIIGKTDKLNASLVGFWDNFINSGMLKFGLDAANEIVNIAGAFDGLFLKIPVAIGLISSLGTAFRGLSASTIGRDFHNTVENIKNVGELKFLEFHSYANVA